MTSGNPAAVAALAAVLVGWFGFAAAFAVARLRARAAGPPGATQAGDPLAWLGLAIQVAAFAAVWGFRRAPGTPLFTLSPVGHWVVAAGVATLALASAALAAAAAHSLGRQFALAARVVEGHQLVTTGPFALMRHPIYTALLGLLLATGLALSRGAALLVGVALYVLGMELRARSEERLLRSAFGPAYDAYAAAVPRFLPRPRRGRRAA